MGKRLERRFGIKAIGGIPFSITNLKMLAGEQYLIGRFIHESGVSADSEIIQRLHNEVVALTTFALGKRAT